MFRKALKRLFSRGAAQEQGGAAQDQDRRREPREVVADGTVEIDGVSCPLSNWSSTGFMAARYAGDHQEGDRVDIVFEVLLPDGPLAFRCQAIVVRADNKRHEFAGVFVMMEREARLAVAGYFD